MTEAERWSHIREFADFLFHHPENVLYHDEDGLWKLIDLRECHIPGWGLITMNKVLEFFDTVGISHSLGGHLVLVRTDVNEYLNRAIHKRMEELRSV